MNDRNSGITLDERAECLFRWRKKNLAHAPEVKARGRWGREAEHLSTIIIGRCMRWQFDPELVRRSATREYIADTPEGMSWRLQSLPDFARRVLGARLPLPTPEVTLFLEAAPDLEEDLTQHAKEAIQALRLRPTCRRSEKLPLLHWVETTDTLTVHYLSRLGGGELTREQAAGDCGVDGRTFRRRMAKINRWGLIASGHKTAPKVSGS